MADIQSSIAEDRYKDTCVQLFTMLEQSPDLKASDFKNSKAAKSVNKSGFKKWMVSQGYGRNFGEWKSYYFKLQKGQLQFDDDWQEVQSLDTLADADSMVADDYHDGTEGSVQYWWLNVDPETWDIEGANTHDNKTISFFCNKKKGENEFNGSFLKWLYCYFIDRKDNPHFSHPININEPGISYLDYTGQKLSKDSISSARKDILRAEKTILGNMGIVINPISVLGAKSYINKGNRSDQSWTTLESSYGNRIGQRHRVLSERNNVDYFYRNRPNEIPKKTNERLLAPQTDPEIKYPNIKFIKPFSLAKEGDIVFACSTIRKQIYAVLEIISINENQVEFWIVDKLDFPCPVSRLKEPYKNYCPGDNLGFFRLTANIGNEIIRGIEEETGVPVNKSARDYNFDKLQRDVFLEKETIQSIHKGLDYKKNIILQGPPGVGKTYLAKRLAFARMGKKWNHRICFIQFHPNYTYEDFIIGYKPNDDGVFKLQKGIFMEFCNMASRDGKNDYYFIIDEINRGNLGKIFGEAFTLIDKDYRGVPMKLANNNKIIIPKNVYIIGLMNTADRSLAMLDFALRRRFKFFTLCPVFDNSKFKAEQKKLKNKQFDKIIDAVVELNKKIGNDPTLGDGFRIGHSYFCNKEGLNPNGLKSVVEDEIIPLLREYWFDDDDDVFESKIKDLRDALKTQNDNE